MRTLLLCVAMFIAGYLTAVGVFSRTGEQSDSPASVSEYKDKLSALTVQIKDMIKEHGAKAYTEINEYMKSLPNDKDKKEQEDN